MDSQFFAILSSLGISIDENSSPIVLFSVCNVVFSFISLLCVFNIIIYLVVMYVGNNEQFLIWISKYRFLNKVFVLYKKTRVVYLVSEFMLLLFCIGLIFYFNWNLVYAITIAK